jgi:ABC-2 type transport system ATP-binding protein
MSLAEARPPLLVDTESALDVRSVTKTFRRRRARSRGRPAARIRRALSRRALSDRRAGDDRGARSAWHTAVDDVSFRIAPGEIFGVIGANGSGKSTLIRVLSTLLVPDSGQVLVFGRDALRDPLSVRPLLNRVSADPSFFRAMSPLENLLFYGRAYGLAGPVVRTRSRQILERLGLESEKTREPMLHMSRGQQQKVAVARAFLTAPRLMLLDEPTTGLDPRSKRDVQNFIAEVRRDDGVAILLTTHDMAEADQLCDRLAFLAGGRVVAEGTPQELKAAVAGTRSASPPHAQHRDTGDVDMEAVFMAMTGRHLEDDEEVEDG